MWQKPDGVRGMNGERNADVAVDSFVEIQLSSRGEKGQELKGNVGLATFRGSERD